MEVLAIIHFLQKGGDMNNKMLNIIEQIITIIANLLVIIELILKFVQ